MPFLSGLAAFKHRVLYGNICNDFLVKYETAFISPTRPLHFASAAPISEAYPHIISDTLSENHWGPVTSASPSVSTLWHFDVSPRLLVAVLGKTAYTALLFAAASLQKQPP